MQVWALGVRARLLRQEKKGVADGEQLLGVRGLLGFRMEAERTV